MIIVEILDSLTKNLEISMANQGLDDVLAATYAHRIHLPLTSNQQSVIVVNSLVQCFIQLIHILSFQKHQLYQFKQSVHLVTHQLPVIGIGT